VIFSSAAVCVQSSYCLHVQMCAVKHAVMTIMSQLKQCITDYAVKQSLK